MRLPVERQPRAFLGQRHEKMTAGMNCYFDEQDRCARITEAFCSDDVSMGALLAHVVKVMQQQANAVYTEVDILATAPRLLKSAEQLGFVPVAYLPAFFCRNGRYSDVVKMVKLNVSYSLENGDFTAHAKSIVQIIDRNFEDQKMGLAIINLLRPLSMFAGLGDGELRKIARLFVQKLYRPASRSLPRASPATRPTSSCAAKSASSWSKPRRPSRNWATARFSANWPFWTERRGPLRRGDPAQHSAGHETRRLRRLGPARTDFGHDGHAQPGPGPGRQVARRQRRPFQAAETAGEKRL
jgi:hypothetical protein